MDEETNTSGAQSTEKTYTQAELDAAVKQGIDAAAAKYPSAEELAEYQQWKQMQPKTEPNDQKLQKERDTLQAQLEAANTQLEQLKQERFLLDKGVPAEDVDYYAFKIGKLVNEKTTFEQAAEGFLKEKSAIRTVTVSLGAANDTQKKETTTEQMNNILRAAKR